MCVIQFFILNLTWDIFTHKFKNVFENYTRIPNRLRFIIEMKMKMKIWSNASWTSTHIKSTPSSSIRRNCVLFGATETILHIDQIGTLFKLSIKNNTNLFNYTIYLFFSLCLSPRIYEIVCTSTSIAG